MFAIVAAILIFLHAIGVSTDAISLLYLGVAFWALHFAWNPLGSISFARRG